MSRENSPFEFNGFWLDKRRDGKSPDIWQVASYAKGSRSLIYRSTRQVDVEKAKSVLLAIEAKQRSKRAQEVEEAELLPQLVNYLEEHGPDVKRLDTIESSFRAWVGFLAQDELTTGARVSDINKVSVARFRRWRMGPHSWSVEWINGKTYDHKSEGVSGEAVQRNIEDLRAALNHAEEAGRIAMRPKIPSVDKKLRSKARTHVFTIAQLGAIVAYADHEPEVQQWLRLMIATGVRPDAGLAFDPKTQWHDKILDLHPPHWPLTDKRNPLVPVIDALRPTLEGWKPDQAVLSRKRWWRTMRTKLGIPATHVPKTIRHTVASYLRNNGVPGEQISLLLGHKDRTDTLARTSEVYAHGDPLKMRETVRALTRLFAAVESAAAKWRADHCMTITKDRNKILIDRKASKG